MKTYFTTLVDGGTDLVSGLPFTYICIQEESRGGDTLSHFKFALNPETGCFAPLAIPAAKVSFGSKPSYLPIERKPVLATILTLAELHGAKLVSDIETNAHATYDMKKCLSELRAVHGNDAVIADLLTEQFSDCQVFHGRGVKMESISKEVNLLWKESWRDEHGGMLNAIFDLVKMDSKQKVLEGVFTETIKSGTTIERPWSYSKATATLMYQTVDCVWTVSAHVAVCETTEFDTRVKKYFRPFLDDSGKTVWLCTRWMELWLCMRWMERCKENHYDVIPRGTHAMFLNIQELLRSQPDALYADAVLKTIRVFQRVLLDSVEVRHGFDTTPEMADYYVGFTRMFRDHVGMFDTAPSLAESLDSLFRLYFSAPSQYRRPTLVGVMPIRDLIRLEMEKESPQMGNSVAGADRWRALTEQAVTWWVANWEGYYDGLQTQDIQRL